VRVVADRRGPGGREGVLLHGHRRYQELVVVVSAAAAARRTSCFSYLALFMSLSEISVRCVCCVDWLQAREDRCPAPPARGNARSQNSMVSW
jgi:hypothetical protein